MVLAAQPPHHQRFGIFVVMGIDLVRPANLAKQLFDQPLAQRPMAAYTRCYAQGGNDPPRRHPPDEVLASDSLMELIRPILPNDYHMIGTYRPDDAFVGDPILVLCGTDDVDATDQGPPAWGELTTAETRTERFPGGHVYLGDHGATVIDMIKAQMAGLSTRLEAKADWAIG